MPGTVLSGICISINLVPTTALRGGYCYYPSATYKLKRGYYSQFVLSLYSTASPQAPFFVRYLGEELFISLALKWYHLMWESFLSLKVLKSLLAEECWGGWTGLEALWIVILRGRQTLSEFGLACHLWLGWNESGCWGVGGCVWGNEKTSRSHCQAVVRMGSYM